MRVRPLGQEDPPEWEKYSSLPKWACHSPKPTPLTVSSSHQVCISGAHSFFLVVCLQLKSLCRSALVFGKHVSNSLLSFSFSLWRPNWFPRWFSGKGSACCCRRCRFNSSVAKIPCRRKWPPTPVFLLEEFHGQRSLVVYSSWGRKDSNMTENAHRHGGLITLTNCLIFMLVLLGSRYLTQATFWKQQNIFLQWCPQRDLWESWCFNQEKSWAAKWLPLLGIRVTHTIFLILSHYRSL